jgi:hypothetical protein
MSADNAATNHARITREKIELLPTLRDLALVSVLGWALQLIATELTPFEALGGMAVLYAICAAGLLLARFMPFYLPSVAWISLIGIAATLPFTPWDGAVLGLVAEIDFLALSVPCLAYAGLAVSRREIDVVKKSGWKLLLVAVFVLAGTYLGSALIADVVLRITG